MIASSLSLGQAPARGARSSSIRPGRRRAAAPAGQQAAQLQADHGVGQRQQQRREQQPGHQVDLGGAGVGPAAATGRSAGAQGLQVRHRRGQVERLAGGIRAGLDRTVEPGRMRGADRRSRRTQPPAPAAPPAPASPRWPAASSTSSGASMPAQRAAGAAAPAPRSAAAARRTRPTAAATTRSCWRWCGPAPASPCRAARR